MSDRTRIWTEAAVKKLFNHLFWQTVHASAQIQVMRTIKTRFTPLISPETDLGPFWLYVDFSISESAALRIWKLACDTGKDVRSVTALLGLVQSHPHLFTAEAALIRAQKLGSSFPEKLRSLDQAVSESRVALRMVRPILNRLRVARQARIAHDLHTTVRFTVGMSEKSAFQVKELEQALDGCCEALNTLSRAFDGSGFDCRGGISYREGVEAATVFVIQSWANAHRFDGRT